MVAAPSDDYRDVLRQYARLAPRYDTRWQPYLEASVRETLERLDTRPGDRILDVGCGTGILLEAVAGAEPAARLVGLDLSPHMLEQAVDRLGWSHHLVRASAEELPFGDAVFDRVVSTSVLHFVRGPLEALGEIRRVLRPSGVLVITDWCDDYLACRVLDRLLRRFDPAHVRTYGSDGCRQLLERAGFEGVQVDRYKISWLWGLMTATGTRPGSARTLV